MLNKTVYTLNIVLILFWSFSLNALWRQISHQDNRSIAEHDIKWVSVQKATKTWEPDARNLFDTKPIALKKATPEVVAQNPEDALNEKGLADVTLRVRGIFTSRQQRFAVIDKVSKKTSKKESVKVSAGSVVAGFTVSRIQPDVVTLVYPSTGDTVILKIFKPLQDSPAGLPGN
ncbi:MAG: hypothetical protein HY881_12115 [Deltaproteobacteria bacterium]|nr:hypothetical protein [Deltaproteobacteria bacterium]